MPEIAERLAAGERLAADEMQTLVTAIMDGAIAEVTLASILTSLRIRGESADELVGAATALRDKAVPWPIDIPGLLDTCGTGGDRTGTFNISTATALVTAACGVPVAKHGNRSVSSTSGSADVFAALGVRVDVPPAVVAHSLRNVGIGFLFAPHWHPAMKQVAPVRRLLGFRTIFNLVGPLSNPARAPYQLVGVPRADLAVTMAAALAALGVRSATIVTGDDGLDEVTLSGSTQAIRVGAAIRVETWTPENFGLPYSTIDDWQAGSPAESAAIIGSVLDGECGPKRDIVLANTAAALLTAEKITDLKEGVALAAQAIDAGRARRTLDQLIKATNAPAASDARGGP